jgi:hypothetical protein
MRINAQDEKISIVEDDTNRPAVVEAEPEGQFDVALRERRILLLRVVRFCDRCFIPFGDAQLHKLSFTQPILLSALPNR